MNEITVTAENYDSAVLQSAKPVLLDFWAEWCGPCKMLSPILAEIASENDGIVVGKVNVDEQPQLAFEFKVAAIPSLFVIKNGEIAAKSVGFATKEEIEALLK